MGLVWTLVPADCVPCTCSADRGWVFRVFPRKPMVAVAAPTPTPQESQHCWRVHLPCAFHLSTCIPLVVLSQEGLFLFLHLLALPLPLLVNRPSTLESVQGLSTKGAPTWHAASLDKGSRACESWSSPLRVTARGRCGRGTHGTLTQYGNHCFYHRFCFHFPENICLKAFVCFLFKNKKSRYSLTILCVVSSPPRRHEVLCLICLVLEALLMTAVMLTWKSIKLKLCFSVL